MLHHGSNAIEVEEMPHFILEDFVNPITKLSEEMVVLKSLWDNLKL